MPVAPTAEPFADGYPVPRALATHEIAGIVAAFRDAARRALAAGFDIAEIHAAHGYLIHEFLSPLVNTRADQWRHIRWPDSVVRGGARCRPQRLARRSAGLRSHLVDRLGARRLDDRRFRGAGATPRGAWRRLDRLLEWRQRPEGRHSSWPRLPGPVCRTIRREAGIATGAVGLITSAAQADAIVAGGQADCVLLARELLQIPTSRARRANGTTHGLAGAIPAGGADGNGRSPPARGRPARFARREGRLADARREWPFALRAHGKGAAR